MQGQRKANLKYQNSMGISGVSARCIYGVIGWFRIGFVMLPVLKKKCWTIQEQSSYQSWCWRQEHLLHRLVPRLHPSVHQELQPSHVDSGLLHWRFLQLHPGNKIIVNQGTYVWYKFLNDELPGCCWTLMDLEGMVLVSWWHALWSSSFSWSRLGGQCLQKFVFAWKPTGVSLDEQSLSLSSLVVILCRRVH